MINSLYVFDNSIRTFAISIFQVFHSLLKAHAVEARAVVKQALEILTPAMPGRMEDGNVSQQYLEGNVLTWLTYIYMYIYICIQNKHRITINV